MIMKCRILEMFSMAALFAAIASADLIPYVEAVTCDGSSEYVGVAGCGFDGGATNSAACILMYKVLRPEYLAQISTYVLGDYNPLTGIPDAGAYFSQQVSES